MKFITIFTPTYNRGYKLPRLYKSLKNQSCKQFTWIIVDDGSNDNTEEIVEQWKKDGFIDINYIKTCNGGKHRAYNIAIKQCKTDLFVCVDSDDILSEDAIEIIKKYYQHEDINKVSGFYGKQSHIGNEELEVNWPLEEKYIKINELYSKYKYRGETIMVFKTDLVNKYKFTEFAGEKFITEASFYDKFANGLPMRMMKETLYFSEYLEDGYTSKGAKLSYENPLGFSYYLKQRAILHNNLIYRIKCTAQYMAWIKVNDINQNISDLVNLKLPLYLKISGKLLIKRYIKLFKKMKLEFESR